MKIPYIETLALCKYKFRLLFVFSFKSETLIIQSDQNEAYVKQPDTTTTRVGAI